MWWSTDVVGHATWRPMTVSLLRPQWEQLKSCWSSPSGPMVNMKSTAVNWKWRSMTSATVDVNSKKKTATNINIIMSLPVGELLKFFNHHQEFTNCLCSDVFVTIQKLDLLALLPIKFGIQIPANVIAQRIPFKLAQQVSYTNRINIRVGSFDYDHI